MSEERDLLICDTCGQHAEIEDEGLFYSRQDGNGYMEIG